MTTQLITRIARVRGKVIEYVEVDRGYKTLCHEVTNYKKTNGYYIIRVGNGRRVYLHREIYLSKNIVAQVVRHKCDNRACIRLEHLTGGTYQDNSNDAKDAEAYSLSHCRNGHEYTFSNTKEVERNGRTSRKCLKCEANRT